MTNRRKPTRVDRRGFLRRAALFGAAVGSPGLLAACATSGSGEPTDTTPKGELDPKAPLDVVIFKGGFSDEYGKYFESMYAREYPDAEITHSGIRDITKNLQTRFTSGSPPDVVNNSGDGAMDTIALIEESQVAQIGDVLKRESWDIPGKTVEETLIEGSLQTLTHEDKIWGIPYVMNINGLWYDTKLFADQGWEFPDTWDGLMQLGEQTKKAGIPLWIYQGQYPQYMTTVFNAMVQKHGGNDVMKNVDNLEDGAWLQDPIKDVAAAFFELKSRGHIRPGIAGMTHVQAQNAWAQHKAAVVPCGTWLKNEIGSQLPDDFEMTIVPTPSLDSSDVMPMASCPYAAGENFIVPSQAKNVPGGMEFLRIMLSKEGAQKFAELTSAITIVDGVHDEQDLDPVVKSSSMVLNAAREAPYLDQLKLASWYVPLSDYITAQMGQLLTGDLDDKGFLENIQKEADKIKADEKIEHYTR